MLWSTNNYTLRLDVHCLLCPDHIEGTSDLIKLLLLGNKLQSAYYFIALNYDQFHLTSLKITVQAHALYDTQANVLSHRQDIALMVKPYTKLISCLTDRPVHYFDLIAQAIWYPENTAPLFLGNMAIRQEIWNSFPSQ